MTQMTLLRKLLRTEYVVVLVLIALSYFNFALLSPGFGLHIDDWMMLNDEYSRRGLTMWLSTSRPLSGILFATAYYLFGFNLGYYYPLTFLSQALGGIVLFLTLNIILGPRIMFNFFLSAIYVIYPAVLSHIWLIMLGIHMGMLLSLLTLYVLARFFAGSRRNVWLYILSLFLYLLCLITYELPVALIGIAPLIVFVMTRNEGRNLGQRARNALLWSAPYAVPVVLWAIYRFFVIPLAGLTDPWIHAFRLSDAPSTVSRVWSGLGIMLLSSWRVAVGRVFASGHLFWRIPMLVGMTVVCALVGYLVYYLSQPSAKGDADAHGGGLISYHWGAGLLLAGIVLIVLGYLPTLPTMSYYPRMEFFRSRINYAATVGGAMMVASVLVLVSRLLVRGRGSVYLFSLLSSVLLGLVSTSNYTIQQEYAHSWQVQREVWNNALFIAPDVRDNTRFLFIGRHFGDYFISILTPWELNDALQLLYENETLEGDMLPYEDVKRTKSSPLEMFDSSNPESTGNLLLLEYDDTGCVRLLRRITDIPGVPRKWSFVRTNGDNIMLSGHPPTSFPVEETLGPRRGCWDSTYRSRAVVYGQRGMWSEVVRLYDEAMAKGDAPTSPDSLAVFLQAFYELGKYDEARRLLEQVPAGNSAVLSELVELSAHYAAAGEKEKRAEVDQQLVQLLPNPQSVNIGGLIEFLGYKGERLADGNYELDLYFRALKEIPVAYGLFFRVNLVDDPRGSADMRYTPFLPTTEWAVGQIVRETIVERVPYNVEGASFDFYNPGNDTMLRRQDNREGLIPLENILK
jgi:tetratricopeptide (TPR) repeat protein